MEYSIIPREKIIKKRVKRYDSCEAKEAVIPSAYALPCKYVIHTIMPHYFICK